MIDIIKIGLLYDFYENLLTDRQKDVMELYLIENLSLKEISEELDITRQGVHDIISRTAANLIGYEEKLQLMKKMIERKAAAERVKYCIENNDMESAFAGIEAMIEG